MTIFDLCEDLQQLTRSEQRAINGGMDNSPNRSKKAGVEGLVLGLGAFEKISAVEGICLSAEMKRDLATINGKGMTSAERIGFINGKYGKRSA